MKRHIETLIALAMIVLFTASLAQSQTRTAAPAPTGTVTSVTVTEHGIYTIPDQPQEGQTTGGTPHRLATGAKLASTTYTIPAGSKFGFRYVVNGSPDGAAVPIRLVLIYPRPVVRNGATFSQDEYSTTKSVGQDCGFFFNTTTDGQYNGTMTLQVWSGDRMLTQQIFTVQ